MKCTCAEGAVTQCSNNMLKNQGIIYDLDGTLVSSESLHESAWKETASLFGIVLDDTAMLVQKGMGDEDFASVVFPSGKQKQAKEFARKKSEYVQAHIQEITLFPGVQETMKELIRKGYQIWICTGGSKQFVESVFAILPELQIFKGNVVWRERYKNPKPAGDGIEYVLQAMGRNASQVVYFCSNLAKKDPRIPEVIPVISTHEEIWSILRA
jgi:beta-phosphoglucomutase